jgi:hypothetical protein
MCILQLWSKHDDRPSNGCIGVLLRLVEKIDVASHMDQHERAFVGCMRDSAGLRRSGSEARRRAGAISAFELEESRRQLNRAQESAIVAARDRAQAWVELVRRSSFGMESPR